MAAGLGGFVSVDLQHAGNRGGYIDNLHADPSLRGRGIGRRLLANAARQVIGRGETQRWLTVLAANAPARAFYRAICGQERKRCLSPTLRVLG